MPSPPVIELNDVFISHSSHDEAESGREMWVRSTSNALKETFYSWIDHRSLERNSGMSYLLEKGYYFAKLVREFWDALLLDILVWVNKDANRELHSAHAIRSTEKVARVITTMLLRSLGIQIKPPCIPWWINPTHGEEDNIGEHAPALMVVDHVYRMSSVYDIYGHEPVVLAPKRSPWSFPRKTDNGEITIAFRESSQSLIPFAALA